MTNALKFYIDGAWVEPSGNARLPVVDPCTEEAFAEIAMGTPADVDRAVAARETRVRVVLADHAGRTPRADPPHSRGVLERYDEMARHHLA